jgi:hypothetical protein
MSNPIKAPNPVLRYGLQVIAQVPDAPAYFETKLTRNPITPPITRPIMTLRTIDIINSTFY